MLDRETDRPSVWPDLLVEFQRSINSMLAYWHGRGASKITVIRPRGGSNLLSKITVFSDRFNANELRVALTNIIEDI